MRLAESVTFGGAGMDRAAHLRGGAAAATVRSTASGVVLLWHGKPLCDFEGDRVLGLALLRWDHPILAEAGPPIFLGIDGGMHLFAVDLLDWAPEAPPTTLGAFSDPSQQEHPALPREQRFVELRAAMLALDARTAEIAATAKAILGWHAGHGYCSRCGVATIPAMDGWQRDCPSCGARHFPRTDPVVIMLITRGNAVLLGRSPGWPDRMYSLLAGFVEPGETVEAAVRREVHEEVGISVGSVGYLASQPWPFPASLMIGCHGEATSDRITCDPVEIEDAAWVSRDEMLSVIAGRHERIAGARPGAIARFLIERWLADTLS